MKARTINAIWGIVLILAGGLFLAQNAGWIGEPPEQLWKFIFAGLSLLFFASYFINGVTQWGWLFPACIFAALSFITFAGERGFDSPLFGTLIMWSIAAPFLVAFGVDRKNNWWALIPAWVMLAIGGIIVFSESARVSDDFIAGFVLLSIALPFFVVYLMNRKHWWALIPAGVMTVVTLIVVIASNASEDFVPVLIMLAIALPFFFVYSRSPQNWWAIVPAGFMTTIAVGLLVMFTIGEESPLTLRAGGVFFLGWGLTFGFLWLRRAVHDTGWAKWPAIALIAFGLGVIVFGAGFNNLWPLIIIAAGIVVLYLGLRKRQET